MKKENNSATQHHRSKLTPNDICEIQNLFALRVPVTQIAKQYNVTSTAIKYHNKHTNKLSIPQLVELMRTDKKLISFPVHITQHAIAA